MMGLATHVISIQFHPDGRNIPTLTISLALEVLVVKLLERGGYVLFGELAAVLFSVLNPHALAPIRIIVERLYCEVSYFHPPTLARSFLEEKVLHT